MRSLNRVVLLIPVVVKSITGFSAAIAESMMVGCYLDLFVSDDIGKWLITHGYLSYLCTDGDGTLPLYISITFVLDNTYI